MKTCIDLNLILCPFCKNPHLYNEPEKHCHTVFFTQHIPFENRDIKESILYWIKYNNNYYLSHLYWVKYNTNYHLSNVVKFYYPEFSKLLILL